MNLHEDRQLFTDTVNYASRPVSYGGLGIGPLFIEKDYWMCRSLKLMSEKDTDGRAVLKGGTSLTKVYGVGARFSEDLDIAIADAGNLSGNQLKNMIRKTAHNITEGLKEVDVPGKTSKGSHYHKAYYSYPVTFEPVFGIPINPGRILVEINAFANPYPHSKKKIESFLTAFLRKSGNESLIEKYGMQPFDVSVLDKRRTLIEKIVSLLRCSLADDYYLELSLKIRHFYDLYYLINDEETLSYFNSDDFRTEFAEMFNHDRWQFEKPAGWTDRALQESPLICQAASVWAKLESTYQRELSALSYKEIPSSEQILDSINAIFPQLGRINV